MIPDFVLRFIAEKAKRRYPSSPSVKPSTSVAAGLTDRVMEAMCKDGPSAEPLTQGCIWCGKPWDGHLSWCNECAPRGAT